MPEITPVIQGSALNLSARQLKDLTKSSGAEWPDDLINDYLSILSNILLLSGGVDSVIPRIEELEFKVTVLEGKVSEIELELGNLTLRVDANETAIGALGVRVTNNESKISSLDVRVTNNENDIQDLGDNRVIRTYTSLAQVGLTDADFLPNGTTQERQDRFRDLAQAMGSYARLAIRLTSSGKNSNFGDCIPTTRQGLFIMDTGVFPYFTCEYTVLSTSTAQALRKFVWGTTSGTPEEWSELDKTLYVFPP